MTTVRYAVHGSVAVVTLARPSKRNAIDPQMSAAIEAAIDRYERDDEVRVAVLDADMEPGHPVFCAGHDLTHFRATFGTSEEDDVTTASGGFAGLTRKLRTKPLIAAVDGLATAGGCEMVLACDIVIASRRAAFSIAEVKWNLVASGGGGFRLPRAIGAKVAMDMLLTAAPIDGARAHQLGLVSRLVSEDTVTEAALEVARGIASHGPLGVALSKRLVDDTADANEAEAWQMLDAAAQMVRASQDLREGLAAFAAKREPQWQGR